MLEDDIDDTHLCIKCSSTIVGLDNYVQHRKSHCSAKTTPSRMVQVQEHHPYDETFDFNETPTSEFSKPSEEVEKVNKSLSDSYDLPYDLGADIFFQSLELQSSSKRGVVSAGGHVTTSTSMTSSASVITSTSSMNGLHNIGAATGGKVSNNKILTRKSTGILHHNSDQWISSPSNNADNLMKAVRDISGHKKCDSIFTLIPFQHDSPEQSDDGNGDEDDDSDDEVDEEEEEEDYEMTVPAHHTGGKWKPENVLRNSPGWDASHNWHINDQHLDEKSSKYIDEFEQEFNHPPPSHTKGKWVPGTKVIKLDYKEVEIEKIFTHQYWCNTCNRKLASKILYERHLKSNLHLKRAEPEQELEKALVQTMSERMKKPSVYLNSSIYSTGEPIQENSTPINSQTNKRKRRKHFIKCETCNTRLPKYLLGKHLISHYHYRRMIVNPTKSLDMVLENIHRIVRQSPFQCKPCHFYCNTEENFIYHWNSNAHLDLTEGPGQFWCTLCKFECEDNNQMRRHLLCAEHKEVVLAINRSVPIFIRKKIAIECTKCKQNFRYNIELRKHADHCSKEPLGTASNDYQSKFECEYCGEILKSKLALQKHDKVKHKKEFYFCSICKIEFETALESQKHRNTSQHKITVNELKNRKQISKKCKICLKVFKDVIALKNHISENHPNEQSECLYCGLHFPLPQTLGRHIREKICRRINSENGIGEIFQEGKCNTDQTERNPKDTNLTDNSKNIADNEGYNYNTISNEEILKVENTQNLHKCQQCDFTTQLSSDLMYHKILHTLPSTSSKDILSCPICAKTFRKHSLRLHLRLHTNERIYQCKDCPLSFTRKYNWKEHINKMHLKTSIVKKDTLIINEQPTLSKSKKFQCDTCGKVFNKAFCLKQHINVHTERDERFKCLVGGCFYIGRNNYDLKIHSTTHENDKNYQCNFDGCKYRGKNSINLKKHQKTHLTIEKKKYECSNCDFTTEISSHLKRHTAIHTGEKLFKCPHCKYACNNLENLRRHVVTTNKHQGKFLYECVLCPDDDDAKFKSNLQKDYRNHIAVVHKFKNDINELLNSNRIIKEL